MGSRIRMIGRWRAGVVLIVAYALCTVGCNLFGRLDNPGELQDKYAAAVALANDGDCAGARDLLLSIQPPTSDDVYVALGWAYLCVGNATAANIASSLYKFSSSSSDFTVVGTLARNMLPMTADAFNSIHSATEVFSHIANSDRRNIEEAIAQLAFAAAILARQASADGDPALVRNDISDSTCSQDASSCATTTHCTTGMTPNDVQIFIGAINTAASDLSLTTAGDLQALAKAIQSGLGVGTDAARCFIFNSVIPNP